MYWRSGLQGVLQGDIITPLVFVLICVPGALLQSTPSNPVILAPFSALEGSSVNLTCISTGGNPLPTVTWYRGNQIVDQSYRTNSFGSTTQTINDYVFNVYRNDSSVTYRCDVDNVNLGSPLMKTAILTVYVQPGPPVITGSSVLTAGSTYTHKCRTSAGGNPIPTLNWMLGNQSISNLAISRNVINLNDNTYIVEKNITWVPVASDNGKNLSCALSHNETLGSTTQLIDSFIITVQVLPNITTSITSYSRTVGDSVTLACSVVAASPSVTSVYWTKLSNSVTTNVTIDGSKFQGSTTSVPSLTINTLQTTDAGVYTCNAVNAAGTGSGLGILLSITGNTPTVQVGSSTYTVNAGNTAQLVCTITSQNPSATSVTWQKLVNGVRTTFAITGRYSGGTVSNPTLSISNVQTSDAGTYYCFATNSVGQGSPAQTVLAVQSAPSVSIPSSSYPVNYNANTTLICNVTATPSATGINWYKVVNGVDTLLSISGNSRLSGGTTSQPSLTVTFAVFNDEGSYKCEASNLVGATRSVATFLDVIGSSPTVTIPISSYSAVYGNSVTINCTVSASPAATLVSWQQIVNSQSTTINPTANPTKYSGSTTSTPSLTINNLVTADSGYYVCSATNPAGTTVSGQTLLTVTGTTPTVSANPTSYSENYGTNVTLQCSVSGNPAVTAVYWSKTTNGVTTNITTNTAQSSSKYSGVTVSNPSLQITSLTLSDSGSYVCFGINSVGSSQTSSVTLNVIGGVPSVTIGSAVAVIIGNNATIQCSFTANPNATSVSWQRTSGGQTSTVTIGGRFSGGSTSDPSLKITNAQSSDEGSYRCFVTNNVGQGQSGLVFLDVQGNIPTVTLGNNTYSVITGQSVTIDCTVSATPTQTLVYWQVSDFPGQTATNVTIDGQKYSGGTIVTPSLTITDANATLDEGYYRCFSVNAAGQGQSIQAFLDVTGNVPTVTIPSNSYSATYGNSITIPCSIASNPSASSMRWEKTANSNTDILTTTNSTKYSGGTLSDPPLTISNLNFDDQATYRCVASNQVGDGFSIATFLTVQGNAPTVSVPQNFYSALIGTNAQMPCSISANPATTSVYWLFNPTGSGNNVQISQTGGRYTVSSIANNPTLSITNVTFSDTGTYTCTAVNAVGTGTDGADFNVTGSEPSVSIGASSYTFIYGSVAILQCSVSAVPNATSIYWRKTANSINTFIYPETNQTKYGGMNLTYPNLEIYNVNFDDQGIYNCFAINLAGTGTSSPATLLVNGSSPSVSIAQQSYSVLTGNTITIPCTITASPSISNRYWIFDPSGSGNNVQITTTSGRYTLGANTNSPSLTISNAVAGDAGTYMCFATNLVGTTSDSATLTITGDEPNITISVTSYSILLNGNVTLACQVETAQPSVNSVAWRFRSQGSSSTSEINIAGNPSKFSGGSLSTPSLTITQLANSDEGYYICTATNLVGTGNGTEIFLNVSGSGPTVSIPSSSYSVLQTQDVTLQCNVNNASPSVTSVTWYYSTTANNPNPSMVNITGISRYSGGTTTTPSLTITGAESGDAGYYRCSATNAVSTATSGYTSLAVTGATPSGTSISGASSQDIDQTNTLSLTCSASGDPTPTITWSLNGQTLSSTNGVYTQVNVQRADDGVYTCTATNSLGSQTATVDVNVRFAPVATSSQQTINAATGSTQTLTCSVEANPTASYQWTRNNVVVGSSNTYTKTFGTGDFDDYICTATNTLGTATVTFTVSQSSASVGASTASGGLTTGEIAAIVLAVLLILLLIIVICICCCTHGVCGAICGKKKDAKGRVEPVKEKEVYKETIRHIEIPRFEEKPKVSPLPPIATDMSRYEKERDREGRQESFRSYPYGIYKRREHSAVSRRDVDVNVKRENDYDIVRYETVPPAGTYYGDTIMPRHLSVHDDVRASPRPHRLPALTTYTYEEAERRRKHRRKKKKHRRRHDDEEVIVEKVRTASPVRVIEEVAPVRVIEEPAETVIVERVRTASPVRYVEEPAQDVIIESVRRSPSTRRKRSDEEEMIVRTSSRSPSRRRRHEERYVTTERVVNGDVYRDGGDLRAINGEVYRDSGEYSLSRHGSGRFTRESRSSRRKEYAGSDDVEVEEGSAYYVERR